MSKKADFKIVAYLSLIICVLFASNRSIIIKNIVNVDLYTKRLCPLCSEALIME